MENFSVDTIDLATLNAQEIAARMDIMALQEAANARATIGEIAEFQKRQVQVVMIQISAASGAELAGGETEDADAEGDASPVTSIDTTSIQTAVEGELASKQAGRVAAVQGDTDVVVANLAAQGAAGLYNDEDIVLDRNYVTDTSVYVHEKQHEKDGLIQNLDEDLAPETGVSVIDDNVIEVTARDVLEKRAMDAQVDAGYEVPEAYVETHWATMTTLENRGAAVGVNVTDASAELVADHDTEKFQTTMIEITVREEAERGGVEALDELAQKTAKKNILNVIAFVRNEYIEGPKVREKKAVEVALAA